MSPLLQRSVGAIVLAALAGVAGSATADDVPPAATPAPVAPPAATPAAATPAAATPAAAGGSAPLYRVVDGDQVDANTLNGWHTWRAMACERCHGANQEGLVGPSLVDDLKTLSRDDFNKCVLEGRVEKGMPNFGGVKTIVENLDGLYAFLKGRSDGAVPNGHLTAIQ